MQVKQRLRALDRPDRRGLFAAVDLGDLNAPRWPHAGGHGFNEAWYVVACDAKTGSGLWVRYAVDADAAGERTFSLWGSWFDQEQAFAIKNLVPAAAISRTQVAFGAAELAGESCTGEVEGGGHTLRWRLQFGGAPTQASDAEFIPGWLRPVAKLRGSGIVLPRPAATVSGALEIDGRIVELSRVPAGQAHIWGKSRYPAWAWARCNAFAEDPDASIDLLDVQGPGGVRVPMIVLRLHGETHRFGDLPWIARTRSVPAPPTWHFAAQNATLAIDGVLRAPLERMVQVQYPEPSGKVHYCCNSEVAQLEVRVRARSFAAGGWRPETVLTSRAACLEFCGPLVDARVTNLMVTEPARRIQEAPTSAPVAS